MWGSLRTGHDRNTRHYIKIHAMKLPISKTWGSFYEIFEGIVFAWVATNIVFYLLFTPERLKAGPRIEYSIEHARVIHQSHKCRSPVFVFSSFSFPGGIRLGHNLLPIQVVRWQLQLQGTWGGRLLRLIVKFTLTHRSYKWKSMSAGSNVFSFFLSLNIYIDH